MSYVVLARKWRPRTFSQLIGQTALVNALQGSLDKQRLHHAYLFTGTRGVGKTSVARLFAKALNCEQGISSTPCLRCDTCIATEQGRLIDLIEIDGASRTRVEDTRELLDNVMYQPSHARFKIYIIDEVHMLSTHSFNALLKTLEEPPAHVKFLLATTESQKLPLTVLSRCLQFQLKHIAIDDIVHHLQTILHDEQCTYDQEALSILAKAAAGSMRDALSLLDQALAGQATHLQANAVKDLLGFTHKDYAIDILSALAIHSADELIAISQHIIHEGGQFKYVLDTLLTHIHQIGLIQQLSVNHKIFDEAAAELRPFATQFCPEDVQLFYQIALKGLDDLDKAPTNRIGFEMTLLRMLMFRPAPLVAHNDIPNDRDRRQNIPHNEPPLVEITPAATVETTQPTPSALDTSLSWSEQLEQLNIQGLARTAAENAEYGGLKDNVVTLIIDERHKTLLTTSVCKRLEDALSHYHKAPIRLAIT